MNTDLLSLALKEWASVIRMLEAGRQVVLFRKGGIREVNDDFEVEEKEFLLYPSFEHQKADLVKDEFLGLIKETMRKPHANREVKITSFARVQEIILIRNRGQADALYEEHIWNSKYVDMRLNYKPDKPLYVLLLRVFRLGEPLVFEETSEYIGCRSWVQLNESASIRGATPVIPDKEFKEHMRRVSQSLGSAQQTQESSSS